MGFNIRKAAVIGSGTMGGGIAALLAGVGIEVTLLDIAAPPSQPGDAPAKRSAIAIEGLKRAASSRPAQFFSEADQTLIRTGNIDDDLGLLADCDWVIEVVVERLDVKRALMAKLAEVVKPEAIVSTNTSGLPIKAIAEGMDSSFTRRFLGAHFFNPPRYLHLLEVIPGPDTDPAVIEAISTFATARLGKGVVLCKDEPNFIGNRFMTMSGMQIINDALDNGFTVDEIDALTGPLIGRPRTATFRLNDLVGNDVAAGVARNLYPAIPHDPARPVLEHPGTSALFQMLLDNKWLGNKSGQGFYKMVKGASGEKEFWSLDLTNFSYLPPSKPQFESVGKHRKVASTGERIRLLINEPDRAGQLLFRHHAFLLAYASNRVPEITESLMNIDNAQKWGFSHELGPFEIWDAIGVRASVPQFEAAGFPVAPWVHALLEAGHETFYRREAGLITGYYSPQAAAYVDLMPHPKAISAARLRAGAHQVAHNASASLLDMGDGVALLDMHSLNSAIDSDLVAMFHQAVDRLESDFDALVVGSEAERFSVGANLFGVSMAVQGGNISKLEAQVSDLQQALQRLHYASRPVVMAPYNTALGGGAEMIMAGARVVAHAELYAGLVEVGVGVIPAGGGCKELLRRIVNPVMASHANAEVLPHLQRIFEQIMLAKTSESAKGARDLAFLGTADRIVMNRTHLLGEAKREALHLADGYIPQRAGKIYAAGRDAYAALLIAIESFIEAGQASEHDAIIARELALVLTGGAISEPGWVDEQVILDLERRAFIKLVQTEKTLARMAHMVQTSKPLRN